MTTLNISLPEDLKKLVDRRVAEGGFATHSEYVRSLIRQDRKRMEQERIEAKLLRRLSSESVPMNDSDFDRIRDRLKAYLSKPKRSRGTGSKK